MTAGASCGLRPCSSPPPTPALRGVPAWSKLSAPLFLGDPLASYRSRRLGDSGPIFFPTAATALSCPGLHPILASSLQARGHSGSPGRSSAAGAFWLPHLIISLPHPHVSILCLLISGVWEDSGVCMFGSNSQRQAEASFSKAWPWVTESNLHIETL